MYRAYVGLICILYMYVICILYILYMCITKIQKLGELR